MNKRYSLACLVLSALLLSALLYGLTVKTWHIQTVDYVGEQSGSPALVVDSNRIPHISYTNRAFPENYSLKYATWTGSKWAISLVTSNGTFPYSHFMLDSNNNPYIVYYDYDARSLKYATPNGSSWSLVTVDVEDMNDFLGLILDSKDNLRICYSNNSDFLRYATWTGTNWVTHDLASAQSYSRISCLALDSKDNPHICYLNWNGTDSDLNYAEYTGSEWVTQTIDSSVRLPNLVLDHDGNPHIGYYKRAENYGYLKYAERTDSNWSIQTIELASPGVSIALDSSGKPHVSYETAYGVYTMYAVSEGTQWNIQTIDENKSLGSPSLAIDSAGNVHIACERLFRHGHGTVTYGVAYVTLASAVEVESWLYWVVALAVVALVIVALLTVLVIRRPTVKRIEIVIDAGERERRQFIDFKRKLRLFAFVFSFGAAILFFAAAGWPLSYQLGLSNGSNSLLAVFLVTGVPFLFFVYLGRKVALFSKFKQVLSLLFLFSFFGALVGSSFWQAWIWQFGHQSSLLSALVSVVIGGFVASMFEFLLCYVGLIFGTSSRKTSPASRK